MKLMTCQECGQKFENIGLLRKHQIAEHPKKEPEKKETKDTEVKEEPKVETEEFIIPKDKVYEFRFTSPNHPVKVMCLGTMSEEGLVVKYKNVKYVS